MRSDTLVLRIIIISNDPDNPYAASRPHTPPNVSPGGNWSGEPPQVIFWAKVYNTVMIALYIAVTFGGVAMIVFADAIAKDDATSSPTQIAVMGGVYAGLGVILTILFAVAFVWRKGTGAWIYQIVLIVLGLTSCCTWPATIPLMIYWIKDKDRIIQS